jgi:hypothetical protein
MDKEQLLSRQALIKQANASFNARDIDAVLRLMHPAVKWPMAWGRVRHVYVIAEGLLRQMDIEMARLQ